MKIFKTKFFMKWAKKQGVTDKMLFVAVSELHHGLFDANLGGDVYKKRIPLPGLGKRGGARTIIAYKADNNTFFVYGFAKNEKDNISSQELVALKLLASRLLSYDMKQLSYSLESGELIEVRKNDGQ